MMARKHGKQAKRFPKAKAQKLHAKRRAEERYGLALSNEDLRQIIASIQSGKAVFLERQSHRVTIWRTEISSQLIRVVYDCKRHSIASVLPLAAEKET